MPFFCLAQDPMYWQLTDEDGLPSMTVYDILQDAEGYIWLGTAGGLCRYDGNKVIVFNHPNFKDQEIIDIEKDNWNRTWMINLSGQIAYIQDGKINLLAGISPNQGKEIKKLHIEGKFLWILYKSSFGNKIKKQLLTYELSENQAPKLLANKGIPNVSMYIIESDQQDHIMILGKTRQHYYISRYDSLLNLTSKQFTNPTQFKSWSPIIADIGNYQGQSILAMVSGKEKSVGLFKIQDTLMNLWYRFEEPVKVNGVKMTGSDFWLMSNKGIWTVNVENNTSDPPKLKKILNGINTNNILRDREGSYWVVTTGQGAIIIPSLSLKQKKITYKNQAIKEVSALLADPINNQVISGHHEGIIAVHKAQEAQEAQRIIDFNKKGKIRDIFQSKDKEIYCITNSGSLVLDSLVQLQNKNSHGASKKLLIDRKKQFWLGTSSGVLLSSNIRDYQIKDSKLILNKRTYALHESADGQIWIGSIDGLYYYKDSLLSHFDTQDSINYFITDFAETDDGTLWVSSQTKGIFAIKNNQVIQRYNSENGLSSNDAKRLFWDGQFLWICTNQGLNYLEPTSGIINKINKKDGLPSNEVNDVTVLQDQVWVGTSKGLVYFPKNRVYRNSVTPLIYLSNFKVWDKTYSTSAEQNELSAKQNNLAFEFIGIALKAKNAVTYKYRIVGIDQDWVYTDRPIARYPVVNPGLYHFEVFAINEDGVESEKPAILTFTIASPWWQKWWVIGLSLLVFVGILFYLIQRHLKKENQKYIIQRRIDKFRQKALQTQMNPHFIFNALSAIQKSLTTNESEKALLYLSRFAKLIRSIFEYSKREEITLEEEIDFLNLYLDLEKLRFKNKINIDFSVDPKLEQHLYSTLLPPLLLQPLVENAFKHGLFHKHGEGHLQLKFSKDDQYLCFSIEDNGIGRAWAKKLKEENDLYESHQSSGISNIKERLSIINSKSGMFEFPTLDIEDIQEGEKALGTRIKVYIYCKNFELQL